MGCNEHLYILNLKGAFYVLVLSNLISINTWDEDCNRLEMNKLGF